MRTYRMLTIPRAAPPNPIHAWNDDPQFVSLFRSIATHTIVDHVRCFMLAQFCRQVNTLAGDVAEVGVYRGGTAKLLATLRTPGKDLHLFDTFAGMPTCDPARDKHSLGDFADTSETAVRDFLGDAADVHMHKGVFPATGAAVTTRRFSLVHVDCDIYQSVLDCCRFFHPRMVQGGVLVFDDYGFVSCPGAKNAVDEYFATQLETPIYLPTGQAFVVKL
ncbi:MAG TPA: TylF/MycF/NovP-related O-methyltransferase [Planctomycetota bacterium]|nr:TylF/MycF/NovP-related O-methyltransferase [Planctomycetota bacterium]